MRIRRLWLVLVILLIPAAARADDHTADFFGAFSFARASNLFGFNGSVTLTSRKPSRNLSLVVADISTHVGEDDDDNDERKISALAGLRYTFTWKDLQGGMPFVHVLAGGVHTKINDDGDLEPGLAIGAGWDNIFGRTDPSHGTWGVRVQGDYIVHAGRIMPRLSVGVVKRVY